MFFDQLSHLEEGNSGSGNRFVTVEGLGLVTSSNVQVCSKISHLMRLKCFKFV